LIDPSLRVLVIFPVEVTTIDILLDPIGATSNNILNGSRVCEKSAPAAPGTAGCQPANGRDRGRCHHQRAHLHWLAGWQPAVPGLFTDPYGSKFKVVFFVEVVVSEAIVVVRVSKELYDESN